MTDGQGKAKPYTYHAGIAWTGSRAGQLESPGKPGFHVASPAEFKGERGGWSPENEFVASVNVGTMMGPARPETKRGDDDQAPPDLIVVKWSFCPVRTILPVLRTGFEPVPQA